MRHSECMAYDCLFPGLGTTEGKTWLVLKTHPRRIISTVGQLALHSQQEDWPDWPDSVFRSSIAIDEE